MATGHWQRAHAGCQLDRPQQLLPEQSPIDGSPKGASQIAAKQPLRRAVRLHAVHLLVGGCRPLLSGRSEPSALRRQGVRGLRVTAYLGKLVESELRRRSQANLAAAPADGAPHNEAIAALEDVRRSIDELDDVAGRLARAAV
ncbi:MAG: hypothetical protein ACRDK0_01240 [Solirubrobacteraceae bacterium]